MKHVSRWHKDYARDEARTPPWLFELFKAHFGEFDLDVAANGGTSVCDRYLGDALTEPWLCERAYCFPPPNGEARKVFLRRAQEQVEKGFCKSAVVLCSAGDPSTRAFRECLSAASEVMLLSPRITLRSLKGELFEMRASIAYFRKDTEKGKLSYFHIPTALEHYGLHYVRTTTLLSSLEEKARVPSIVSSTILR